MLSVAKRLTPRGSKRGRNLRGVLPSDDYSPPYTSYFSEEPAPPKPGDKRSRGRPAQPVAREWYARMLLERNAAGDRTKARGLLSEALAMYESMEMPFHANRTSGRLASL